MPAEGSHGWFWDVFKLTLDSEDALEGAEARLTSEGASAAEPMFQLVALPLKVYITIEDMARPG